MEPSQKPAPRAKKSLLAARLRVKASGLSSKTDRDGGLPQDLRHFVYKVASMAPKKRDGADGDTSVAAGGAEADISYSGKQIGESETLGLDNYELPKSQVVKLAKSVVCGTLSEQCDGGDGESY